MKITSGWRHFAAARFSPSMLAARGREILDAMVRSGIQVPPSNRITNSIRTVERSNDYRVLAAATDVELHLVRESFRTLWEFFFIGYTWRERARPGGPFTHGKLLELLGGADLPEDDSNSRARDTQFELFVASTFVLGGASVQDGEPDLRMLYYEDYRGIAVKRIRTLTQNALRNAIRDGARQIRESTPSGFLALNVDTRMVGLETDQNVESLGASFNRAVTDAHKLIQDKSDQSALLGAFIFGTRYDWNREGNTPRIEFHLPHQLYCFTESEDEITRVETFLLGLEARLDNAVRAMARLVVPQGLTADA